MDRIEEERARERRIRWIARGAWVMTFVVILTWVVLTALQIRAMGSMMGGIGAIAMLGVATPILFVVLGVSVLIATLSTIGLFLRQRRASFDEIQLRLATLEELLTARDTVR